MVSGNAEISDVTQANLASHLIDVQLPEPVGWWPPAIGWWGLLLSSLAVLIFLFMRRQSLKAEGQQAIPVSVITQADAIYQQMLTDQDAAAYWHLIGQLLRKTAIRYTNAEAAASLQGDSWVHWLENSVGRRFTPALRDLLVHGRYQSTPPLPDAIIHGEITDWLTRYFACDTAATSPEHCDV